MEWISTNLGSANVEKRALEVHLHSFIQLPTSRYYSQREKETEVNEN
jgi:hypothetical protein